MKRLGMVMASAVALAVAGTANAATLIKATVTGSGGVTVWNTAPNDTHYALFVQVNNGPGSPVANPNDEPINLPITNTQGFLITGDGYPASTNDTATPAPNSDPLYNLTLNFSNGATITGMYTPTGNVFSGGTSAVLDGAVYTLTDFSWNRDRADVVNTLTATPGGDPNDYHGNFQLTQTSALPEPGTWAMMLIGFGAIGFSMRRKSGVASSQAKRFAPA